MIVIHGVDRFGKVDGVGDEYLVTRFHHVFLLPIVPIGSEWVTRRDVARLEGRACRLSLRSVVAAYARTWGLAIALFLFSFASAGSLLAGIVASALALLGLGSFAWRRTSDARELRRIALQQPVLGIALDPLRLPRDTVDVLVPAMQERFDAVSGGRTAREIAERGASSPAQAAHAFVLARLLAAAGGHGSAEARWVSDRLIDWHSMLAPECDADPYRSPPRPCVAESGPLLAGYVLAPHRWYGVLATLALWVSCVVHAPSLLETSCGCGASKDMIARAGVKKLAFESYPQWMTRPANHGACPTLRQLAEYGGSVKDPWGEPYRIRCGDLPEGAVGVAIWSEGENRRDDGGAGDDIPSWTTD